MSWLCPPTSHFLLHKTYLQNKLITCRGARKLVISNMRDEQREQLVLRDDVILRAINAADCTCKRWNRFIYTTVPSLIWNKTRSVDTARWALDWRPLWPFLMCKAFECFLGNTPLKDFGGAENAIAGDLYRVHLSTERVLFQTSKGTVVQINFIFNYGSQW